MAEKEPLTTNEEKQRLDLGALIAIGLGLGVVFGTALDHLALGISFGLALATLVNAYYERKEGAKGAGVAFAATVLAVLVLVGAVLVSAIM